MSDTVDSVRRQLIQLFTDLHRWRQEWSEQRERLCAALERARAGEKYWQDEHNRLNSMYFDVYQEMKRLGSGTWKVRHRDGWTGTAQIETEHQINQNPRVARLVICWRITQDPENERGEYVEGPRVGSLAEIEFLGRYPSLMSHTYTCAECKRTFVSSVGPEEAEAEYKELFPESCTPAELADRVELCDPCFRRLMGTEEAAN